MHSLSEVGSWSIRATIVGTLARLRTWADGNRATGTVPFGEGRGL